MESYSGYKRSNTSNRISLTCAFFVVGMVKTCSSYTDVKKPEHARKLFVRFAIAKGMVTYGMELMLAFAVELFAKDSLNTFAKQTNVDINSRFICYNILELGKQLMPIGMLVILDSILNRITANREKRQKDTYFH